MVKKLVDYHIHTEEPFLDQEIPHAIGTWKDYWEIAKKINAEHSDFHLIPGNANHPPHYFKKKEKNLYPYERNGFLRGDRRWEFFLKKNLAFRDQHPEALLGLEVDFFPDVSAENYLEAISTAYLCFKKNPSSILKNKILKNPFDYLILSNHFVFGRPFDYDVQEFNLIKTKTKGEIKPVIEEYWQNILKMTLLGKKISAKIKIPKIIIGHLDLIKIISLFEKKQTMDFYSSFENIIHQILLNIKKFGFTLEYNVSGLAKNIGGYPDPYILKKAQNLNLELSFGSDAHSIKDYPSSHLINLQNISFIQTNYKFQNYFQ